jgi:hypothetical protein
VDSVRNSSERVGRVAVNHGSDSAPGLTARPPGVLSVDFDITLALPFRDALWQHGRRYELVSEPRAINPPAHGAQRQS